MQSQPSSAQPAIRDPADGEAAAAVARSKVLVVDDALDMRVYLRALLRKWGYAPVLAANGAEGLARLAEDDIRLVLLDWMMDGMSGPEVCAAIRARDCDSEHYVYIVMLTGRTDNTDLVYGLDAGADDFVPKPFDAQVLRARLQVGTRILELQARLGEQNRHLKAQRDALDRAYGQIQDDLAAAARIQHDSLPTSAAQIAPLTAAWLFLPAAQVSGDSFNFITLSERLVGFYLLDVSGHGIPAALLSTSVSHSLVPLSGTVELPEDYVDPANLLAKLNRDLCRPDGELTNYATMIYGVIDRDSGRGRLAIAGHPPPMIVRRGDRIEQLAVGGLPIGMFEFAEYLDQPFRLDPGDRLVLFSDGATECFDANGIAFEVERLQQALTGEPGATAEHIVGNLGAALKRWRGQAPLDDDVSALMLERPAHGGDACGGRRS